MYAGFQAAVVKKQACIAIGINHYQFFQPLSYAQQDAEALLDFLVGVAHLPADRCVLLTDTSPPALGHSTSPTRENIQAWLNRLCRELVQPGDTLWCFFSGYGVSWNGQDYLMPAFGNPTDIPATGIPVREIFATLKAAPAETVLLLLDMNRASSTRAGDSTGTETAQLAKQQDIPTILSSRPGQFSRETAATGHGLFAAALLEALRYSGCTTLESLERYLNHRLPELSEHYGLPVQEPLTVVSNAEKIHLPIFSQNGSGAAIWRYASRSEPVDRRDACPTRHNGAVTLNPHYPPPSPQDSKKTADIISQFRENVIKTSEITDKPAPGTAGEGAKISMRSQAEAGNEGNRGSQKSSYASGPLLWGGAVALAFLLGIAVGKTSFVSQEPRSASPPAAPKDSTPAASMPAEQTPSKTGETPVPAKPPVGQLVTAAPQTAPGKQPASNITLDKATLAIQTAQASQFSYAIAIARKVPPEDPLYARAQENIDRWGQVILDIARARSQQGKFDMAISAAKLVPRERPALDAEAKQLIEQWQGQSQLHQANQNLLRTSARSMRWGQASSYRRAINSVRSIGAGQPKYAEAQQLIAQWSQGIFNIAQYRARRGWFSSAIAAASLVPEDTPAYAEAQRSLAQWKRLLASR
jgi:uncharacterized caspase-like protein